MREKSRNSYFATILTGFLTIAVILLSPLSREAIGAIIDGSEVECRAITLQLLARKLNSEYYHHFSGSPLSESFDDFERAGETHVNDCAANGGSTTMCNDLERAYKSGGRSFVFPANIELNQQTCNIHENGKVLDFEIDAPLDPFTEALWRSKFKYNQHLQGRCVSYNSGLNQYTDQGPASPYKKRIASGAANDKKWVARQLQLSNEKAVIPLAGYLEKHCKLDYYKMKFNGLKTSCGGAGESSISVSADPQSPPTETPDQTPGPNATTVNMDRNTPDLETLLIRLADWGAGRLATDNSPFQLGPENQSHENGVKGSCNSCCSDGGVSNKAYLFGGPDQSIIVGQTDVSMSCTKNGECGSSSGDPRICTHDGLWYDFQSVGEYVLARTDDFEVQARQESYNKYISINTASAVRIKGDRVGVYVGDPLRVTLNGEELDLSDDEELVLPGGAVLSRKDKTIRVSSEKYAVETLTSGKWIYSIRVSVPEGTDSKGLLGNRNGDPKDDLRTSEGDPLTEPLGYEELYNQFGSDWRVDTMKSLFDYEPGISTKSFTDLTLPWRYSDIRDVTVSKRKTAEEVCNKAGIKDPIILENCIYDVGLTGDESFADAAAAQQTGGVRLVLTSDTTGVSKATTADGVTIELPSSAYAAHNVDITISGPAREGNGIGFGLIGETGFLRVYTPYSNRPISEGEKVITLSVPFKSGKYVLRYMDRSGNIELLNLPFTVLTPKAEIEAAETAGAGKSIDIRVQGDIGENTKLNVVPVGSPTSMGGPHFYLEGGIDETGSFQMPTQPGEYEIRFMSDLGNEVYATKRLTVR